ncbi:hypothetical protein BDZ97DRAFT_1778117 [Flammula alnicola]|nr:hypothetical protein BDZ97DRAFT_1778117 [Flammula alnicola]
MAANHISIPLGIIIGLLASFVQSLGLTIQRKSHVLNQSLPEHRRHVEHRRPLWLLGFAIFISSNILGSFVQIASLPVVILAPLGAVSLLWNAFFARLLLGDVFSPWMILGTILIAGGAILIAFFGIVPEQTRSLEDLLQLFRRPTFIVYFSILGFVVFVCLAITHLTEFSLSRRLAKEFPSDSSFADVSPSSMTINLPTHSTNLTTGLSDAVNDSRLATERTPLIDPKSGAVSPPSNDNQTDDPALRAVNRTRLLLAISYASFSGIISGMCLLFAKSGVELLVLTLGGNNQFWRWESWVLLLGLVAFALLQLWYLHKALILADPTLVCPSAFCFYNLSSIVNGLVYFNQFSLIPPLHLGLVSLGILVLLCGVWVVSIQPGSGGGVDVGTWNEEVVNLEGEDVAMYSERQEYTEEDTRLSETAMTQQAAASQVGPHIGPVPMDRETRSESSLPNILTPQAQTGLGLDIGPEEVDQRLTRSTILLRGKRPRAETQLYTAPRIPSRRLTRRPIDVASSHLAHSRTVSYPHPNASLASVSPPLGTVSTLSTGFQIGLSPLSPGFTIMPLERRHPRPSFADVVGEVVGGARERRRTMSEGEATSRLARGSRGDIDGEVDVEADEANSDLLTTRAVDDSDAQLRVSNRGAPGRQRWRWLRNVFTRRD